jgi:mannitol/fructose-specific phosphotransferase system IIA component (Ntr-type)
MSALAVNDLIGWVIFTVVLTLFSSAALNMVSLGLTVGFTIGFAALALWLGPRLSTRIVSTMHRRGMPEPSSSLTLICLTGLLFGAITQNIGIHALFGFFIAGVVIGEAKPLSEESRTIISQVVYSVFVPVFFAGIGLKIDFLESFDIALALFVSLIGIAGRLGGAWLGVTMTRSFTGDRQAISIAHTPGGVMEIVVSLLAFNTGLITGEVFVAIVFAALFSSTLMGPWMSRAIHRRPPAVVHYAHPDIIVADSTEATRDELIARMSVLAAKRGGVAFEELFEPVISREREYSTALGNEIAVPHARIGRLEKPLIAYAHSLFGVDWNSPDGKPAHHVFLIAVPKKMESEQVRILASLARMMADPESRQVLETSRDPDALSEQINRRLSSEFLAKHA